MFFLRDMSIREKQHACEAVGRARPLDICTHKGDPIIPLAQRYNSERAGLNLGKECPN